MKQVASSRGVELVLVDHTKPLLDQGEYDAIVHKLRPNKDWERNLQEYVKARPSVKVIDSLAGIRIVHNRATMLLPLREHPEGVVFQKPGSGHNGTGGCNYARVQSPTQVEILEGTTLDEAQSLLRSAGLVAPLLVKPLWTDGREGSHGLAVLHDMGSLGLVLQGGLSSELKPPLVVQQFVEHGGVLFKVYVLGHRTVVCRRPSLGDFYLSQEARAAGVLSLPRVSCKSTYAAGSPELRLAAGVVYSCGGAGGAVCSTADLPAGPQQQQRHQHEPSVLQEQPAAPPDWVTTSLAGTLREKLGLQLFNFDMICPVANSPNGERLYYVVDINYFPGVDKIPDFERVFIDFLADAVDGDRARERERQSIDELAPAPPPAREGSAGSAVGAPCRPGRSRQASGCEAVAMEGAAEEEVVAAAGGDADGGDGLSSVPSAHGELDRTLGAEAPSAPAAEVTSGVYQPMYE
ncbi:hypothetical protein GPECTOR_25g320 [Gonium pectorale]|uniref:Uncharacterized protein n=1 Tax=Gonium pectorale TaxID=33097 RepID=A0A150GFY1_GONPE|nr:hypothetical protein GPECTOR_25g320 [Gonium pectorale]|eukprot:KXZ48736.1 hypothetical protein GPECTOR_25g320 [Gonium pectorale]